MRVMKGFALFQKRAEPAEPQNFPSQARGVEDTVVDPVNLAWIVPLPDHQRPLRSYPHPCCWNVSGKYCDCRFLGKGAWGGGVGQLYPHTGWGSRG